jgi:hypothetical protein
MDQGRFGAMVCRILARVWSSNSLAGIVKGEGKTLVHLNAFNFGLVALAALLTSGCIAPSRDFALTEVSPGIFDGYKPRKPEHFEMLRAKGVRTILSLEQLPWDIWPERRKAEQKGFQYLNVPIMASPLEPPEKQVKKALLLLNDPSLRPIYIHCMLGEDRNTFIIGLYRIYFQGWTPEAAWDEMLHSGFHVRWTLRGFDTYFWSHTQIPEWARTACSARAAQAPTP